MQSRQNYLVRKALVDDREGIKELISESARGLSRDYYSREQIEAAIQMVFGVDTNLILDGTYMVVESDTKVVGCGGWSKRKTLFGGDQFNVRNQALLDPSSEPAKIRAFFVHPEFARKGIGRCILKMCETEATEYGFHSTELMATLPGVPFYKSCGYREIEALELELDGNVKLELLRMGKELNKS